MDEVLKECKNILEENESYVVACSSGPDSMAMLSILLECRKEIHIELICAHVNHKLRDQSEEEYLFLKDFCAKNDVVFEYLEILSYNNENFHHEARGKRYEFFSKMVTKYQAKYLFTAHHGDDLVETMLMRQVRGSSLKGMASLQEFSNMNGMNIYRPFLKITKAEILNYLEENKIQYYIDESNDSPKYTRNRYRKNVLPHLKEENNNVHLKYLQFSQTLHEVDEFLVKYTRELLTDIMNGDNVENAKFINLDNIIKKYVLEVMLFDLYQNDINIIEQKHLNLILDAINKNKTLEIDLPLNKAFYCNSNYFRIYEKSNSDFYKIELKNEFSKENYGMIKFIDYYQKSNYTFYGDSNEIALPLYVRNMQKEDRMTIKNFEGTKKLSDIFINEKIGRDKRYSWPIIVDSNDNIIWIPGIKKSKFDKEINEKYDIMLKYSEEKKYYEEK